MPLPLPYTPPTLPGHPHCQSIFLRHSQTQLKDQKKMRNKKLSMCGCLRASSTSTTTRGLNVRFVSRTSALFLGLLLAISGWFPLVVHCADENVEMDILREIEIERETAQSDGPLAVTGGLEASMHSSLIHHLEGVREGGVGAMDTVAVDTEAPATPPTAFPDSSAAVGRVFTMKVPNKMEDASLGEILKMSEMGKASLPAWLFWDDTNRVLQGLPLDGDKGVHYISVSVSNHTHKPPSSISTVVFSIEVHPEDHLDSDPSAQISSNLATNENEIQAFFMCGSDAPVTVLTVILDADLTKMSASERVGLMDRMGSFSGVESRHMRMLPVVNNRLFDMSAFMAGPGNAKKVVENGALLSWKLGCSLDQSNVPNINSVQGPAKEGSMSAKLGYPVVGWHIANKKPHVPKRLKRQLYNTPTPVLTVLPPTTLIEPPVRIVPTLSSPAIAAPTESSVPVRGPVPLPGKPTIRVRESISHTPTLGPPVPTKVMETTSTVSIQPTMTRPIYVETTPTLPAPTRRPTKKPKRPKTTPVPREPKTTTPKPTRRTTPPSPGIVVPGIIPVVPDPYNEKPVLRNPIDQVNALVGTYFEVKIPLDTFFDKEDGTTDKLKLTLRENHNAVVGESSWIQFNTTSQLLYGLPDVHHAGKHEYFMQAADKGGLNAIDAFEVRVSRWPSNDKSPVTFTVRLDGEPRQITHDIHKKILLVKKLAYVLGDRNSSTVSLKNITKGSIVVEWTNTSLPSHPCPKEQIQAMSKTLANDQGRPTDMFRNSMAPDFRPLDVSVKGRASCKAISFVPPGDVVQTEVIVAVTPALGTGRQSTDDVYLHTVIPAVVVAAILLIAGIIAMICYRKKRKGKLTIEDQATFIKKGVPIIFADELDDSKTPPSSSMPLILQEEKPPLPPPEYPNMATPETMPLNQELLGEYTALRDEDPNAPPYQPPPPFTTPMEGNKGSRPKNMTPYRSPPPYVPP